MDSDGFEPFHEDGSADQMPIAHQPARATEASRTQTRRALPEPRAGKETAVLHQPRRHVQSFAWVMPLMMGGVLVGFGTWIASWSFGAFGKPGGIVTAVLMSPIAYIGLLLVFREYSSNVSALRGSAAALCAKSMPDGWVRLVAPGNRGVSLLVADGAAVVISAIREKARRSHGAVVHDVELSRGNGAPGTVSFRLTGGMDDEAFLQLRAGLRAHGLRCDQLPGDLPPVETAKGA